MEVDRNYKGLEVKIEWIDSCASNIEWVLNDEFKDYSPVQVDTFGKVVKQTDEYIVVAQNVGKNPLEYCNLMTIPLGCVKSINEITILN